MDSLEREIYRHRTAPRLPSRIARRIDHKYDRHEAQYGTRIDELARSLKGFPGLYNQRTDLPTLDLFFRPHHVIELEKATHPTEELWCVDNDNWVSIVRPPNRMLVRNPLSDKLESWGHVFSASKSYDVHHQDGGRSTKSIFSGNFKYIEPLERAVFAKGYGILVAADKMQLYANFEKPIGKSRAGKELTYLCLMIERIPRPRRNRNGRKHKSGWMVQVHGYPVGREDIARDLRGTEVVVPNIPLHDNLA
jgi:hypothetical protein